MPAIVFKQQMMASFGNWWTLGLENVDTGQLQHHFHVSMPVKALLKYLVQQSLTVWE